MKEHYFSFELKPEIARVMKRSEYKKAASTLRLMRRMIHPYLEKAQPDIYQAVSDILIIYGHAPLPAHNKGETE